MLDHKITVIGGSGFVGTNLCRWLENQQIDFEIIDLRESYQFSDKCKIGDVRDIESLRSTITGNVIVNLAAVHRDDVNNIEEYYRTNVNGAGNIAQVCIEKGIGKIVFTSSVAVYGFPDYCADESGKINPFNDYGRSKFEAEEKFRVWKTKTGNSLIIVRPTVIFGEGNRGNVYNLFRQIASGKFVMIGAGENKKSMAYIGNVVAFIGACIRTEQDDVIINYVDTPDLSMNELVIFVRDKLFGKARLGLRLPYWIGLFLGYVADFMAILSGKKFPISSIRVKKFVSSTQFLSSKADLDGFIAPFSLEEGLEKTLYSEFIAPDDDMEVFYTE